MLFLLRPAQCLSPELVCVREPAICCVWACSAYVWAREERRDSQLCRASAPEIPVCLELPGAKETKAQMLPVDCSLGLHLSLGIHKPIYSQHRTQLCSGPTFLLSWPCVCVCARARVHKYTSYHLLHVTLTYFSLCDRRCMSLTSLTAYANSGRKIFLFLFYNKKTET